jgi:hypothetical protein
LTVAKIFCIFDLTNQNIMLVNILFKSIFSHQYDKKLFLFFQAIIFEGGKETSFLNKDDRSFHFGIKIKNNTDLKNE